MGQNQDKSDREGRREGREREIVSITVIISYLNQNRTKEEKNCSNSELTLCFLKVEQSRNQQIRGETKRRGQTNRGGMNNYKESTGEMDR